MNDDGYTIFCGRCGAEMNSNSRYCMKCGYLNPEHEANQSMQKFMPKEEAHRVGEQSFVAQNEVSTQPVIGLANNSGNHVACFLVNLFCYLGTFLHRPLSQPLHRPYLLLPAECLSSLPQPPTRIGYPPVEQSFFPAVPPLLP